MFYTSSLSICFTLSIDKVAEWAAQTNFVTEWEVMVVAISKARFLISLLEGLALETFIATTLPDLWDMRVSFQRWNPVKDAKPRLEYKIQVHLVGIPPHLYKEQENIN